MTRAVLDPGVLISALLSPDGAPAALVLEWLNGGFELVVSPALLEELGGVLQRPKFRRWITEDDAREFVEVLRLNAVVHPDPPVERGLTPDPGDDYLVALARAAGVACLVSGDSHLTALVGARPPVLTPKSFLGALRGT